MPASRRPLIGITTDYTPDRTEHKSHVTYAHSVERAGGLPLLLPHRLDPSLIPQIVDELDGLVFSGGDDLDPSCYGESFCAGTEPIDPNRERFERALLIEAERRGKPALGICLGLQLMNVHRGGSLVQFLPDFQRANSLEHRRLGDWSRRHDVHLAADTALANVLGKERIVVNTSHKQAVRELGRGLRAIATSPDGIIEGIEDPTLPLFLGVQWHPERITDQPEHLAIFQLLVKRAAGA